MNGFCLDTNALIDLHWRRYPRRIFDSLWKQIDGAVKKGDLKICTEALAELEQIEDGTYKWAKSAGRQFVLPLTEPIQDRVTDILTKHPKLVRIQKGRAKSQADPFVIATADVHGLIVVTAEQASGDPLYPKIPDACRAMKIDFVNLVEMFDRLGWKV